jgi:N-acetylmuramate 1-kinase
MADVTGAKIDRDRQLPAFLTATGFADAKLLPLTSGLSAKRFYRIPGQDLVVLDARSVPGLTLRYEAIALAIAGQGGIVPRVHFADHETGFALVDYLGACPLSQLIDQSLNEPGYFLAATRALAGLHCLVPPAALKLPEMSSRRIASETLVFGRIAAQRLGKGYDSLDFINEYEDVWARLSQDFPQQEHLVLADFEPENLMHLEGIDAPQIGILDFDEAFIGDQAYDLASLVESARRTTDQNIVAECIALYASMTEANVTALTERVKLWSLQRHLRILGIFLDRNKPSHGRFDKYVPNLVACISRNLTLEQAGPLRRLLTGTGILELILTPSVA